jgi:exopolyphosphatase/guanosine-5'-triphosphate,3'-diphosphate pyrophosphatase
MQIATLDIGTNTVLLLIAEIEKDSLKVIRDDHAIARLGEGVDRTKHISEDAFQRFLGVLKNHLTTTRELGVEKIVAVGTSALRDAENRAEIVQRTKHKTGIDIEILSGGDEARWTYRGALGGMTLQGNVGVLDIGGGSTEISWGENGAFQKGISLDIGAVRITERCFATSPITREAADDARHTIRTAFGGLDRSAIDTLVAVAGTPTTLAAMDLELTQFDADRVHNHLLRKTAVEQLLNILLQVDTKTLLEHYPGVNKARADILPAGTLILREAMELLHVDAVRVSTHGLRYGIALREAERLPAKVE